MRTCARVLRRIHVLEAKRANRAHLSNVFTRPRPMKVRRARGQHHHAAWRVRSELALVEDVSHTDVEHSRNDRVDSIFEMPVRQHSYVARQTNANDIGPRSMWIAHQDG